jgi:hypothetical protein
MAMDARLPAACPGFQPPVHRLDFDPVFAAVATDAE